jgi:hypothetical protein
MENGTSLGNRKEARKRVEKESQRADMKQHADKLIQGFEKLGASHAKRAIWELFQNAIDLAINCEITIQLKENTINFSHNGNPFVSKTLISLIKQVSSKSGGDNNDDEIGQYGTGFITTHSFGKRILINGSLEESSQYISLNDFEIDRVSENSNTDVLIDKLIEQQDKVYDLVENGILTPTATPLTTFSYITESELEKRRAREAIDNLKDILPYVMVLNDNLKKVIVIQLDGSKTEYYKGDVIPHEKFYETPIMVNNTNFPVYYLKKDSITIALPINKSNEAISFSENLSRLFLYFPLIGSERFGFNFIIHAKDFAPTEPRDGIHLLSENDQVKHKEDANRKLIDKASSVIFDFVAESAKSILSPINLAELSFVTDSNDGIINTYFQELKTKWVDTFIKYPLVDAIGERIAPSNTYFISEELLQEESYLDSIINLAKLFWKNIPEIKIAKRWTYIVQKWDNDSIEYITISKLVKEIESKGNLSGIGLDKDLLNFYNYLVKFGHIDVFDKSKLLPNIQGDFIARTELLYAINITPEHVAISEQLIPNITSRIFNTHYKLDIDFIKYFRKDLSKDINSRILSFDIEIKQEESVPEGLIQNLASLCSIHSVANSTNKRKEITDCICKFYGIGLIENIIPNIETDKFDFDTPIKGLVKLAIKDFIFRDNEDKTYTEKNIVFLKDLLFLVDGYYDYRDILKPFRIFPNQNFSLCYSNKLLIEKEFPTIEEDKEYLKKIYTELKKNIKDDLIHGDFEGLTPITNEKKGNEISLELDNLFASSSFEKINDHPQQKIIYELVNKMTSNKEWETYFQKLSDNKAIIMLAKISDPVVKNDLFSIIGLDDRNKIAQLGALSKRADLDKLIEFGNKAIEDEKRNNSDFRFKHKIGTHIEGLIREKIGNIIQTKNVNVEELQNGQDMVINVNGEIAYYIEVKSRWDNRNSITMSPRQMEESVKNMNNYSLCCVDMCDYYPDNEDRYLVDDITKIVDRVKVLVDIGEKVNPLIETSLKRKDSVMEVTLSGDYRAIIPQPYVNNGLSFDEFVELLIKELDLI